MKSINTKNLGQKSKYIDLYDCSLLDPIPRDLGRNEIGLDGQKLNFDGFDLWTAFELSWLNQKGKPLVAIAEIKVPCESPFLIESKSFKLYLNSFNQTKVSSVDELQKKIESDLGLVTKSSVCVKITTGSNKINEPVGDCIDDIDIDFVDYSFTPSILENATREENAKETIYSRLLKSNCLVTNQPDWGTVFIKYEGNAIDREKLLRYIVSFRKHNEFHEQCVERIFTDIKKYCNPEKLTVFARYTRRGGLDINPFRSDFESEIPVGRLENQ
ncbi:NADPH-dependent 7-cyano-7-deazaguanine reductase QueF [Serratia sp. JSRIV006]|uniref:NADPH-dependent 7-cyano-7-deazaguanine reductase QueF n=1 Tax=Serratia sp. JSRIV006 TaxID=2831896 RepID=UPI001CBAA255|nr:NADPH-dependent 7-cyano-7-deazaguanine reductase QueF [Serratia sp. JSRIV006]UAN65794.1 NADPH-dependent 7-cyano-7-deazaguanine reductase QueF [Serratia sp. JSRIV006]